MACHLLKWIHFETDTKGRELELRYFRDVDGREVDFVIIEDRKPLAAIECKWNDAELTRGLKYLKVRFPKIAAIQISATGTKEYVSADGVRAMPALKFLAGLI